MSLPYKQFYHQISTTEPLDVEILEPSLRSDAFWSTFYFSSSPLLQYKLNESRSLILALGEWQTPNTDRCSAKLH